MGWFSEVQTPHDVSCPKCGDTMKIMQTKGYDEDAKYYMKHGKPYRATLEVAMVESSRTNSHDVTTLTTTNSCDKCNIYATWTMFKKEDN